MPKHRSSEHPFERYVALILERAEPDWIVDRNEAGNVFAAIRKGVRLTLHREGYRAMYVVSDVLGPRDKGEISNEVELEEALGQWFQLSDPSMPTRPPPPDDPL